MGQREPTREELANDVADQFMNSEKFAMIMQTYILKKQPTPLEICFAFEVIAHHMNAQVPHWEDIRKFAQENFKAMYEDGAVGEPVIPGMHP